MTSYVRQRVISLNNEIMDFMKIMNRGDYPSDVSICKVEFMLAWLELTALLDRELGS